MGNIRKALIEHFSEAGVSYHEDGERPAFFAPFTLRSGDVMLVCHCREEAQQLVVRVLLPFHVPAQRRPAAAEFITPVNYELAVGGFEMDYSDGELSFRTGIDVEGDRLTAALVRNMIACSLATTDHFYAGAAAVAMGGVPPTQAVKMAEVKPGRAQMLASLLAGSIGLMPDTRERLN